MSTYATPTDLRAFSSVPDDMTDAAADLLIVAAEDTVDRLVGMGGTVDPSTGRSLTPALVTPSWRRDHLRRATLTLALAAHADPTAFQETVQGGVKGPDFEVAGTVVPRVSSAGQAALRQAAALLDHADLRRLVARSLP